jgi:hypothetical protein
VIAAGYVEAKARRGTVSPASLHGRLVSRGVYIFEMMPREPARWPESMFDATDGAISNSGRTEDVGFK